MSVKVFDLLIALALCSVPSVAQAQWPNGRNPPVQATAQLVINVPAARLDVWLEGGFMRSYPVTVGSSSFPTPIGQFELTDITWNPWWVPPPSPWARDEKTQPPGERNPMGRVKLRFAGAYFLHGTADQRNIGRAASHGCIRLRNSDALELAQFLTDVAGPALPATLLDSLRTQTGLTHRTTLDCAVPLTIRYDLAEVRDSALHLYRDLYQRGADLRREALAALARAGLLPSDLDLTRLDALLREHKPLPRVVPLRAIVLPHAWDRLQPERSHEFTLRRITNESSQRS
jgi:murein L,D-transpeptidase YcbB/YkuD